MAKVYRVYVGSCIDDNGVTAVMSEGEEVESEGSTAVMSNGIVLADRAFWHSTPERAKFSAAKKVNSLALRLLLQAEELRSNC